MEGHVANRNRTSKDISLMLQALTRRKFLILQCLAVKTGKRCPPSLCIASRHLQHRISIVTRISIRLPLGHSLCLSRPSKISPKDQHLFYLRLLGYNPFPPTHKGPSNLTRQPDINIQFLCPCPNCSWIFHELPPDHDNISIAVLEKLFSLHARGDLADNRHKQSFWSFGARC